MSSVTQRFVRGASASSLALVIVLAGSAVSAQSPTARPQVATTAARPAPAATAARPATTAKTSARPQARRTPAKKRTTASRPRTSPVVRTLQAANTNARDVPTPGAYVNSTLYYDYEPGRLYTVHTSPRFLTVISLRPGEKLISKAAGDTVRWVLGETVQGSGANQQVLVMLKPVRGALRTNVILTTDQRSYLLDARSAEGDTYTSVVSWNYPHEELEEVVVTPQTGAEAVTAALSSVDKLNFSYKVQPKGWRARSPAWQPVRVFDDGLKTYIQFPTNLASTDAPPLFVIGPDKEAQLVNYRLVGGYYVVDRLIDAAELRLGEKRQTVVRITREAKG